ncbi:GNAT family N-acetyltransferase [Enterococcus sp. LJL128]|uniref:GNAT family N-acetyltransferase n=1 Tax=Enterococcus sp. LJL51 TaxID=3416656 RepID=UPI003CF12237
MGEEMVLTLGSQPWQRAASCFVRMNVFVLEKGMQPELEFDAFDLPDTVYAVISAGYQPIATGRFIKETDDIARLTRIATLSDYRGQQLGTQIVRGLEEYAKQLDIKKTLIHAEAEAVPFYEKIGYQLISEVYYEDGVPCQTLSRDL